MLSKADRDPQEDDIAAITKLTPFKQEHLKGQAFARGNMLGGANPVVEAGATPPWEKKT